MTIILTNDDGIDAPGIQALLQAVTGKMIIVAPQGQLSGCGHQVTAHSPIHVDRRSEFEYAVGGTPADCVRIALNHIFPKPDLVLSGINAGGNLGVDVYISGTVAAVREAADSRRGDFPLDQKALGNRLGNRDSLDIASVGGFAESRTKVWVFLECEFATFSARKCGTRNCILSPFDAAATVGISEGRRILSLCWRIRQARSGFGN
jgi:Survival protein SurE